MVYGLSSIDPIINRHAQSSSQYDNSRNPRLQAQDHRCRCLRIPLASDSGNRPFSSPSAERSAIAPPPQHVGRPAPMPLRGPDAHRKTPPLPALQQMAQTAVREVLRLSAAACVSKPRCAHEAHGGVFVFLGASESSGLTVTK